MPEVIAALRPGQVPPDVDARLTRVAGDFFIESIPPGDAYILSTVLRLFDDERAVTLLRNIRSSMNRGARVLVMDFVHPEGRLVAPYGLADLQAMVVYGGRDRSAAEFANLFAAAGLRFTHVIDTGDVHSWVEAVRNSE